MSVFSGLRLRSLDDDDDPPSTRGEREHAGGSREFSDRRKVEREEKREEKCFVKEIHSLVLGWELESQDSLTKLSLSSI